MQKLIKIQNIRSQKTVEKFAVKNSQKIVVPKRAKVKVDNVKFKMFEMMLCITSPAMLHFVKLNYKYRRNNRK